MCFTGCLVHGVLPNSIMSVILVPVLKNKAGNLNSIDNYRPIALFYLPPILSPILFNVYVDELSNQLNRLKTGCLVGNTIVNHLMYADDLVLLCPDSAGLQQMLKVCFQYGLDYDIKYNSKKSHIMIVRSAGDKKSIFQPFICLTVLLLSVRKLNT